MNQSHIPVFLAINKIDEYEDKRLIEEFRQKAEQLFENISRTFFISAIKAMGVDELISAIFDFLPEESYFFPRMS